MSEARWGRANKKPIREGSRPPPHVRLRYPMKAHRNTHRHDSQKHGSQMMSFNEHIANNKNSLSILKEIVKNVFTSSSPRPTSSSPVSSLESSEAHPSHPKPSTSTRRDGSLAAVSHIVPPHYELISFSQIRPVFIHQDVERHRSHPAFLSLCRGRLPGG